MFIILNRQMGFKWMDIGYWSSNKFCLSLCMRKIKHFYIFTKCSIECSEKPSEKRHHMTNFVLYFFHCTNKRNVRIHHKKRNNKSPFILYFAIAYLIVSAFGIKIKLVNILAAGMAINNFWKMLFLAIYLDSIGKL